MCSFYTAITLVLLEMEPGKSLGLTGCHPSWKGLERQIQGKTLPQRNKAEGARGEHPTASSPLHKHWDMCACHIAAEWREQKNEDYG